MQAIIDSLPEHVLNYKDIKGKTIIDYEFNPLHYSHQTNNIAELNEHGRFNIVRPHYVMETIKCNGKKLKVIKEKIEGNIQDAIDNKVKYIAIDNYYDRYNHYHPYNSFEDDVYKLLDAGYIQRLGIVGDLKSNGKQYHVDFMYNDGIGDNITSYYNYGRETAKTVVLRRPQGPITNNLITLGWHDVPQAYPDTITSKFIANTHYTNARDHMNKNQDILDVIAALKVKIEAL